MSKLIWDAVGERKYETGVRNAVLYPRDNAGVYPAGFAWNGITGITESPSGAEPNPMYADDIKYANLLSIEEYAATLEAYTYPPEFAALDGSASPGTGLIIGQQKRSPFGLAYKTLIGNDVDEDDHGYKIHLVYNALASPSEKAHASKTESPELLALSWELSTTPVEVVGHRPTATLEIDSTTVDAPKLAALELILFGDVATEPRLPLPDEIITLINAV